MKTRAFITLVLFGTLWAACSKRTEATAGAAPGAAPAGGPVEVALLELRPEKFSSFIEASGTALPARESLLSVPVSGIIDQILVRRGQRVKKGEVLLRLDQRGFMLAVEQAEAAAQAARAGFATLQEEMKRFDRLLANKAVPQANYDKVKAQYDAAAAQLAMAETGLKQARKALSDSELRAPYDGEITMILKEVGEFAPAMPPTMLMKLVDSSTLQVQTFLSENDGAFVREGQSAEVIVPAAEHNGPARVAFVSPRLEPGSQTFEVRLELENPGGRIKAGSFCRIRLPRRSLEQALLVPLRAVAWEEGRAFVFVEKGGRAERAEVTLGESQGERALVLSGLQAGQKVITSNLDRLKPGQPVSGPSIN
jgi:RND family efflux transporter MFP subunit